MHFLRTEKISVEVFWDITVFVKKMFANRRRLVFMLDHALV